jgi:hypothetical protein
VQYFGKYTIEDYKRIEAEIEKYGLPVKFTWLQKSN